MQDKTISDTSESASPKTFDPFNDRLSRDVRNSLSEAFVVSLEQRTRNAYLELSRSWFEKGLPDACREYIHDRISRYDLAFQQILLKQINDARIRALILWNHGLFFEVHDILESIWHKTKGDEHRAIKGLIKAAGVYVHREYNRTGSAQRLAAKSVDLLNTYAGILGFITNLNVLIEALNTSDPLPPVLEY